MTVGQLKKLLEGLHDDRVVIKSKDEEGNGFEEVSLISRNQCFKRDCGHEIDIKHETLTKKLKEQGYDEEDCGDSSYKPCIVIW